MAFIIEMLGPMLTLAAAFTGIVGNTWDRTASGWRKLTRTGWAASLVATAGFALAVIGAIAGIEKAQAVSDIVRADIKRAAVQLTIPFSMVMWALDGEKVEPDLGGIEKFLQTESGEKAERIDYLGAPPHPLFKTWGQVLCSPTRTGLTGLRQVRDSFHSVLSPKELDRLNAVIDHQIAPRMIALAPCGKQILGDGFKGVFANDAMRSYVENIRAVHLLVKDLPMPNKLSQ